MKNFRIMAVMAMVAGLCLSCAATQTHGGGSGYAPLPPNHPDPGNAQQTAWATYDAASAKERYANAQMVEDRVAPASLGNWIGLATEGVRNLALTADVLRGVIDEDYQPLAGGRGSGGGGSNRSYSSPRNGGSSGYGGYGYGSYVKTSSNPVDYMFSRDPARLNDIGGNRGGHYRGNRGGYGGNR